MSTVPPEALAGSRSYARTMSSAASPDSRPYPLVLRPVLLEKVWGGRRLSTLGKPLASTTGKYGESWELADMPSTSASGAGGGAVRSIIANGPLAGRTLHDAFEQWGTRLLPSGPGTRRTDFPLLIKFLDASENLSVQVHPSPAFARTHTGANLKTECWYIMHAEPGAVIYKGIKPGVTRADFERMARANDRAMIDALVAVPAVSGECHNLPSGTLHALGAGVLVAEVQTPSDTTFRCYDWGRVGRELHVDQTLACISFPGEHGHDELLKGMSTASIKPSELCARLVSTEFFSVDELRPGEGDELTVARSCSGCGGCFAIIVLAGSGRLLARDHSFDAVDLNLGDTALVPECISTHTWLRAGAGLKVLRVRVF